MASEHSTNMEYVIVRGGLVQGMSQLSAEETDRVCRLGCIPDDKRDSVLLVRDYDVTPGFEEWIEQGEIPMGGTLKEDGTMEDPDSTMYAVNRIYALNDSNMLVD